MIDSIAGITPAGEMRRILSGPTLQYIVSAQAEALPSLVVSSENIETSNSIPEVGFVNPKWSNPKNDNVAEWLQAAWAMTICRRYQNKAAANTTGSNLDVKI